MNLVLANWGENFANNAPDGLLVFVLGMLVVFFGMALIVAIISAIGAIMKKTTEKKNKAVTLPAKEENKVVVDGTETEVDDKVKAAIIAAIAAYYFNNDSGCEFKVKRIKRL